MKNKISFNETFLYFFIWFSANFYALYQLFQAQNDIFKIYDSKSLSDLLPGWPSIARLQDSSDIEWNTWKYFMSRSWYHLIIQFIVSEIIRYNKPKLILYWYTISSMFFMATNFGAKHLIISVSQPLIFGAITFITRNKACIWITGILLLLTYNSFKYKEFFWNYLDHENAVDEEIYLLLFSIGWVELRCISFCIDYCNRKPKAKKELNKSIFEEFVNFFAYVLYLPWLYMGPLVLYNEFENSLTVRTNINLRMKRFVMNIGLYLIYAILLDLALHYIYFLAMLDEEHHNELIRPLPTIALYGGGLWMGLEFYLKYLITYGSAGSYAMLDNIQAPPTPRCIVRVHIYSEMWRYFDVGLYRFLIKYIYKPISSNISQYNLKLLSIYKLMASLVTFLFIFLWHGTTWAIFVWSALNFFGIMCEHIGKAVYGTSSYKRFKERVLRNDAMEQRFLALMCAPLLAMSAISNSYLFGGYKVGNLFFERIAQPALYSSMILLISLYSCCHISMALQNVPSRTACYNSAL